MTDKLKESKRLQTQDGLFIVEMEEVSRKRITSRDELVENITRFIRCAQREEYIGARGILWSSPEVSLARNIANYLEKMGWFIDQPLPQNDINKEETA